MGGYAFSLKLIQGTTMKRCEHTMFCFFNLPWTTKRKLCLAMQEWPISLLKKKTFATVTLKMFCITGTAVKKRPLRYFSKRAFLHYFTTQPVFLAAFSVSLNCCSAFTSENVFVGITYPLIALTRIKICSSVSLI